MGRNKSLHVESYIRQAEVETGRLRGPYRQAEVKTDKLRAT
jgi:hypothetical protein